MADASSQLPIDVPASGPAAQPAGRTASQAGAPLPKTGKPVVEVRGLSRVFKDFWLRDRARAVDSLDFVIYPGEIFGLLGPNGSGKSTTIKVLLGLLRPTRGRISVFGKPPTDVSVKSRIGYLPEESYLYPFLNARETLDYYGKLFKLDRSTRKQRIDELLEMVGLQHAQYRPVREYSKGMQRRIGLAQALINDPDLLILDEPTTGLDPIGTRQVKDLILSLGRRGKTVLLSSHLLADVEDCVDRMAILYGGRKREEGTCDELLTSPNRTTVTFDGLDEDTLSEIDALIRERTQGQASVFGVSHPRQTLEQKFLEIVERARAERVATSGATHAGQTAAFLASDAPEQEDGSALLDRLVDDGSKPQAPAAADQAEPAASASAPEEPTEAETVLTQLVDSGDEPEPAASAETKPVDGTDEPPASGPDTDIIGSLLDDGESTKGASDPEGPQR